MGLIVLFYLLLSLDENVLARAVERAALGPVSVLAVLVAVAFVDVLAQTEVVGHAVPAAVQNEGVEHAVVAAAQTEAAAEQGWNIFVDAVAAAVPVAEVA